MQIFDAVRGPMQTVQRAEIGRVILTLQALSAAHVSVDNRHVLGEVGKLIVLIKGARVSSSLLPKTGIFSPPSRPCGDTEGKTLSNSLKLRGMLISFEVADGSVQQ